MKKNESYLNIAAIVFVFALTLYCAFSRQVTGGALGHIVASMILTLLILVLLCESYSMPLVWGCFLSVVFVSLFGIGIEIAHYFLPHRVCDVYDIVTNLIGVLLGSGVYFLCYKYLFRK